MKVRIALAAFATLCLLAMLSFTLYAVFFEPFGVAIVGFALMSLGTPFFVNMCLSIWYQWKDEHQQAASRAPQTDTSAR